MIMGMVNIWLSGLLIFGGECSVMKGFEGAVFITKDRACFTGQRDQLRRSVELTTALRGGNVTASQKLACVSFCLAEKYGVVDKMTRDIKRSVVNKIIDAMPDPGMKSVASTRSYDCVSKAYNKDVCSKIAQLIDCFARDGLFNNWKGDLNAILTDPGKPPEVPPTNAPNSSTVIMSTTSSSTSAPVKTSPPTLPSPVPVPAPPTAPRTTAPPVTRPPPPSTVKEVKTTKPLSTPATTGSTDAATNTTPNKAVTEGNDNDSKDDDSPGAENTPPMTSPTNKPNRPPAGAPEESDNDSKDEDSSHMTSPANTSEESESDSKKEDGVGVKEEDQGEKEAN